MTWHFLYGEPLENEGNNNSVEKSEASTETPAARPNLIEQDETYQKKLFENDLYVWSLLLLGNDNREY